jgi:hypothetical protein
MSRKLPVCPSLQSVMASLVVEPTESIAADRSLCGLGIFRGPATTTPFADEPYSLDAGGE